jgi:hypothetical protein
MEGELWPEVYRLIYQEATKHARRKGLQFSDARVLEVFCWAALHDRPVCWACDERNWPKEQRCRDLPSPSRMSERLRTLSLRLLMSGVLARLKQSATQPPGFEPLARALDSKPLPTGAHSKDRDARWGQAAQAKARGYKLFCAWASASFPMSGGWDR